MWVRVIVIVIALCLLSTVQAPNTKNQKAGQKCKKDIKWTPQLSDNDLNTYECNITDKLYCGDATSNGPVQTGVCIEIPTTDCVKYDFLIQPLCNTLKEGDHCKSESNLEEHNRAILYCPITCGVKPLCTTVAPTTVASSTTGCTADACLMWIVTWIGRKLVFD